MESGEMELVADEEGSSTSYRSAGWVSGLGFGWVFSFFFFRKGLVGDHCTFIRSYHLIGGVGGSWTAERLDHFLRAGGFKRERPPASHHTGKQREEPGGNRRSLFFSFHLKKLLLRVKVVCVYEERRGNSRRPLRSVGICVLFFRGRLFLLKIFLEYIKV